MTADVTMEEILVVVGCLLFSDQSALQTESAKDPPNGL